MLTLLDGINFITKSIVKYRKEILRRKVSLPHHFRAERRYFLSVKTNWKTYSILSGFVAAIIATVATCFFQSSPAGGFFFAWGTAVNHLVSGGYPHIDTAYCLLFRSKNRKREEDQERK